MSGPNERNSKYYGEPIAYSHGQRIADSYLRELQRDNHCIGLWRQRQRLHLCMVACHLPEWNYRSQRSVHAYGSSKPVIHSHGHGWQWLHKHSRGNSDGEPAADSHRKHIAHNGYLCGLQRDAYSNGCRHRRHLCMVTCHQPLCNNRGQRCRVPDNNNDLLRYRNQQQWMRKLSCNENSYGEPIAHNHHKRVADSYMPGLQCDTYRFIRNCNILYMVTICLSEHDHRSQRGFNTNGGGKPVVHCHGH